MARVQLNETEAKIVACAAAAIFVAILFPPFKFEFRGIVTNLGFAWILSPPVWNDDERFVGTINAATLVLEFSAIAIIALVLCVLSNRSVTSSLQAEAKPVTKCGEISHENSPDNHRSAALQPAIASTVSKNATVDAPHSSSSRRPISDLAMDSSHVESPISSGVMQPLCGEPAAVSLGPAYIVHFLAGWFLNIGIALGHAESTLNMSRPAPPGEAAGEAIMTALVVGGGFATGYIGSLVLVNWLATRPLAHWKVRAIVWTLPLVYWFIALGIGAVLLRFAQS